MHTDIRYLPRRYASRGPSKLTSADSSPSSRLERPCMDHMQYLMVRSHNPDGQEFHHPMENPDDQEHEHMSGHAMMATGTPYSHIMHKPKEKYPHQMPADISNDSLSKLLLLSNRLPIDREGEITPVMAWTSIFTHERVKHLDKADFERLKTTLLPKVRCYGYVLRSRPLFFQSVPLT